MRGHVFHDGFRESTPRRRSADQHGRPHLANHFGQAYGALIAVPALHLSRWARIRHLVVAQPVTHVVDQQPWNVHQPEMTAGIFLGSALAYHRVADLIGDPNSRCAGAKNDDTLISEWRSTNAHSGNHRRQRDRACALHIIVEGTDPIAVLFKDAASVA